MSKDDLKIEPVEQELTKEDLKKVSGGECMNDYCEDIDDCYYHCPEHDPSCLFATH